MTDVFHLRVPPLSSRVRTRFAPSPSGELHVGNVRTAMFSWASARHASDGSFILRIEDTDTSRVTDEYVAAASRDLAWIGISWDEGPSVGGPHAPYRQSDRGPIYAAAIDKLLVSGAAYRAFDTPSELEAARAEQAAAKLPPRYDGSRWRSLPAAESASRASSGEPFVVRFAMPPGSTTWNDLVRGPVTIQHEQIPDFALTRAGGSPLYMLAVSVDDVAMELTHIVRGDDLLSATPRQLAIYLALGHPVERWPAFAHVPQVNGTDGKPLSKRNGETSLAWYRDAGFLPEALRNYLGQLGWSLPGGREFFDVAEFVGAFSLDRVQKSAAQFDLKKLEALNGEWIRALPLPELADRVRPLLTTAGLPGDSPLVEVALPELASRMRRLTDCVELLWPLLTPVFEVSAEDAEAVLVPANTAALAVGLDVLGSDELPWDPDAIIGVLRTALVDGMGLKPKVAFAPFYVAVAGRRTGLPVNHLMSMLGRAETLRRLADAVERSR